ncbi:MAG: ABC transporter permease subunit [Armatimonadota bacterium]|nr:ABC transporter permease subunit [Armatimonadota bacterium]
MNRQPRIFGLVWPPSRFATWADVIIIVGIGVLIYIGVELARGAPRVISGPKISLEPSALALYAVLSTARMAAAYILSMLFTIVYGYIAARNRSAEWIMIPLLDVFQSVPILSFLPVVLLSLSAIMPEKIAAGLASIVLIFTSQVWNLTFAWYQSLTTIPSELSEVSAIFRFNTWFRLKVLELPFAAISLIWNSMMSWAGGWFFLMAAEIFTVGNRDFRLPGLGSYLQTAANEGNVRSILLGILTLVLVIVALDQLVWRPLLVWAKRFRLEMVTGAPEPHSWFYDVLHNSLLVKRFNSSVLQPLGEKLDAWSLRHFPADIKKAESHRRPSMAIAVFAILIGGLAYGVYRASEMLVELSLAEWLDIGIGVLATLARVAISLVVALAWTIPVGTILGTNRKLATWIQPVVQVMASIPATAFFPILVMLLIGLKGGINFAAVLLMLMGTQWYLLFNVIAGASEIPQDLKYTSILLGLNKWEQWRTLTLPALFPYIITGAITASGGAWNASIVAEYVEFGKKTIFTTGIGSTIARATATGNFPLLLASTISMILAVVLINRLFWRRLYRIAADRYKLE